MRNPASELRLGLAVLHLRASRQTYCPWHLARGNPPGIRRPKPASSFPEISQPNTFPSKTVPRRKRGLIRGPEFRCGMELLPEIGPSPGNLGAWSTPSSRPRTSRAHGAPVVSKRMDAPLFSGKGEVTLGASTGAREQHRNEVA